VRRISVSTEGLFGLFLGFSPDGSALAYLGVMDDRLAPVIHDLASGEIHSLSTGGDIGEPTAWLSDEVPALPLGLRVPKDTIRIQWGEREALTATLSLSDGSESGEGIWWESLDPAVATVNSNQELIGNRAGTARLLARWGYSFMDTVWAEVEDSGSGGALLMERFADLDPTIWLPFGNQPPEVRSIEGESVLYLRGDERYADGSLHRGPISLDQGVTVEMEFRMNLNRDVHQWIALCLADVDLAEIPLEAGNLTETGEQACFMFPSREYEKMNPAEAALTVIPGTENRIRLPHLLPPSNWTHVALQLRADGQVTLVVDRQPVATNPIHIHTQPKHQWTVLVEGSAVGTEIFVRNLNIWRGIRY